MRFFVVLGCLFFSLISKAEPGSNCPDVFDQQGAIKVQQMEVHGPRCNISFSSPNPEGESRQWFFSSTGRIGAFVTSPGGSNTKSTGVKAYYIIPNDGAYALNGTKPMIRGSNENSQYKVQMAGETWSVDKKTGKMNAPEGCKANIGPIPGTIKGGFELDSCKNKLVLDVGWRLGEAPELNSAASSTFRDSIGHSCSVPNSKIFNYTKYNYNLKYTSSAEWNRLLSAIPACKNLMMPWGHISPASGSTNRESGQR